MSAVEPLLPGGTYHIYNRGNNREPIFRESENYRFFLERYIHHIEPVAVTYAYCLLPNHFHFLVRIREDSEQPELPTFERLATLEPATLEPPTLEPPVPDAQFAFKNLFISYALAFNRRYDRTGSLFEKPFKRKRVTGEAYFARLVVYIHRNAQHHGLVADFRDWPWSSYTAVLAGAATRIPRQEVLGWFGGPAPFRAAHAQPPAGDLDFE
jgi:REP element-mobilizing transposase RayT